MSDRMRELLELPHHELAKKVLGHELAQALRSEAARRGRRRTDPPGENHMHERRLEEGAVVEEQPSAWIKAPGGWSAGARGTVVVLIIVMLASTGFGIYLNRQDHRELASNQREQLEEQQISNYLQSLPPNERPRLNMPGALYRRLERPPVGMPR